MTPQDPDPVVVKIGSGFDVDTVLDDIAALTAEGRRVVIVHGGGPAVDRLCERFGTPVRTISSPDGTVSRRTDEAALDALNLALLGQVKPALISGLRARGIGAIGLNGADGGLVIARRRPAIRAVENGRVRLIRDDRSGTVTHVRASVLDAILATGAVPVVSPPATTESGELLNVDADAVAAELAIALGSDLVLLTGVPGILADVDDPTSVVPEIADVGHPAVHGRMQHKLRAGLRAAARVPTVVIAPGEVEAPIHAALEGAGTVINTGEEHTP